MMLSFRELWKTETLDKEGRVRLSTEPNGKAGSNLEDSSAEISVDYRDPAQEVSRGKILAPGLGTVLVIVWQRMWLLVTLLSETGG